MEQAKAFYVKFRSEIITAICVAVLCTVSGFRVGHGCAQSQQAKDMGKPVKCE